MTREHTSAGFYRAGIDKIEAICVAHEMLELAQAGVTDEPDPPLRGRVSKKPPDDVHHHPEVVLVDACTDGQGPRFAAVQVRPVRGTDQQGDIGPVERVACRATVEGLPRTAP